MEELLTWYLESHQLVEKLTINTHVLEKSCGRAIKWGNSSKRHENCVVGAYLYEGSIFYNKFQFTILIGSPIKCLRNTLEHYLHTNLVLIFKKWWNRERVLSIFLDENTWNFLNYTFIIKYFVMCPKLFFLTKYHWITGILFSYFSYYYSLRKENIYK